jgi:hypothetical protein
LPDFWHACCWTSSSNKASSWTSITDQPPKQTLPKQHSQAEPTNRLSPQLDPLVSFFLVSLSLALSFSRH